MLQLDFWKYSFLVVGAEGLLLAFIWLIPQLKNSQKWMGAAIGCVAFFFSIVFLFAYNLPITDDYFALVEWLLKFKQDTNILRGLTVPYNESRIVFTRAVCLLDFYFFKELNFIHLILFAATGLVFIAYLFIKEVKENRLMAVAIVFLLFQFQYYDAVFWATSALQNIWSLLFGMLCIKLLLSDKKSDFIFLTATLIITVFTYGNGFSLIPVVLLYQLMQKNLFKAVVLGCVSILIFFYTSIISLRFPIIFNGKKHC